MNRRKFLKLLGLVTVAAVAGSFLGGPERAVVAPIKHGVLKSKRFIKPECEGGYLVPQEIADQLLRLLYSNPPTMLIGKPMVIYSEK